MKKLILISIGLMAMLAKGQNLVPNPSFEDTVSCPHFANQIDQALHWHASSQSPDYFNVCDIMSGFGTTSVPSSFVGFQYPKSGDAYAGFIAFFRSVENTREFLTSELISSLIIGHRYDVSMHLNLSGKSGLSLQCNKLGMLFSTVNYDLTNPPPINNYCQFHSDSIIGDTLNWVHLTGSFVADSTYSFLTIGNFYTDSLTDTIYHPPNGKAYYFLDDISVTENTFENINEISTEEVKIFPNPANDFVCIYFQKNEKYKIEIINAQGIIVKMIPSSNYILELKIPIPELPQGVYLIKLSTNNKKIHKTIIKF